jgi:hypothetical protein
LKIDAILMQVFTLNSITRHSDISLKTSSENFFQKNLSKNFLFLNRTERTRAAAPPARPPRFPGDPAAAAAARAIRKISRQYN